MSGDWVTIVPPPHDCVKPSVDITKTDSGSIWRCDCGQHWELYVLESLSYMWKSIATPETPRFGD